MANNIEVLFLSYVTVKTKQLPTAFAPRYQKVSNW